MVKIVRIPADASVALTEEKIDTNKGDGIPNYLESSHDGEVVIDTTVLIRHSEESAGLYAYSISSTSLSKEDVPNIRATTLAMACGLHAKRFVNDVYIGRLGYTSSGLQNVDVTREDIQVAVLTPDLRESFVREMMQSSCWDNTLSLATSPDWLCSGARKNYHDNNSMSALAAAMARTEANEDDDSSESDSDDSRVEKSSNNGGREVVPSQHSATKNSEVTLCLYCRRPAWALCNKCHGAYFCQEPHRCILMGWSHQCLCTTWKLYVQRRQDLSHFPYFSGWQLPLLHENCFTSDETYKKYLMDTLNVIKADDLAGTESTWWNTEIYGWNGGNSASAKLVDLFRRVSYRDGLGLDTSLIPDERSVNTDDIKHSNVLIDQNQIPILNSWEDYYRLRSIPPSSPIALLATFPLTVYYAIQRFGIVPVTVAQMLDRPMKVHLVGIEKELNFMDFFKEVAFILPEEIKIEMTWVVREDMFPESCSNRNHRNSTLLSLELTNNLKLTVISGTYGESLDPNFDIIGGTPDMVIGLNAGLYAYESWRHVVNYLDRNQNVIAVFTDYNEHSGMNCASLGGSRGRQSLQVNPFRQPRAMPVNCMNLPQFSNGFVYVFNEQELD